MTVVLSPNMDFTGLFIIILLIMFGPALVLAIVGFALKKRKAKAAKVLFILATLYLIISLGICGAMVV